ncbi:MAG: prepilin-type cleavage/methylation domain-containing protein [Gammaproteobacteria bacterium]|nr:prepilin-type cleavage/methylation domain-containing protein [Gammaproteobacteria bacterium]
MAGFTLTELAIVVLIVGLLIGGLALTLTAQNEARQFAETRTRLELAQEALIGFAIRNGRLPCPAILGNGGLEAPAGGGACTAALNGVLPGATLGLSGVTNGELLDSWEGPIRYAVTNWSTSAFTTSNQIATLGVNNLAPTLLVCNSSTPTACSGAAPAAQKLTADGTVVAVVYSLGKNWRAAPGADEAENVDGDANFVNHDPRPAGAGGGEYDDIVTWLSVNVLVNRMVAAGAL